ncbi:lipid-A-disaccharide synthase-related protein [Cyanobacterium aponinum AL20118]|uniref:Lipid-A-disaccharide synthase n=2 Tax=Cyanobacterium aponinum TaxID=379064 RepID=A0A844GT19_9CHRO|nr:lipid-A-disaccharide synthase-related protein [Cyanobacterium aponinum]MTF39150.1 hypothetical protein [Cyanobacterium aponinum 0216]PHV64142.1 hypothetical protein CSQ80_01190 [Cyanobacterium aponinum IPPAS B-1201]WPF89917.1 lipid-A-disaccharide synthase-related protein [Cyanobacterium aponinum AL20115]
MNRRLLVISNGHGEDVIAVKIIQELWKLQKINFSSDSSQEYCPINITALPMVGEGFAYQKIDIPLLGKVQKMPSGGFIYMDGRQLWKDIKSGLVGLTLHQYQQVKQWSREGGLILAVGDILPLLWANLSGVNYFFVGTAKSEYYLRNEEGWLEDVSIVDRFLGSIYYPWERWLMSSKSCLGIFPRDSLTVESLQNYGIRAYDYGNPMMDDVDISFSPVQNPDDEYTLKVLLLPGSRLPEALDNWQLILSAVDSLLEIQDLDLRFVGAIASSLNLNVFAEIAQKFQWKPIQKKSVNIPIEDPDKMILTKNKAQLILSQNSYAQSLQYCDISIAMAGTATEQFVGLGKPAIAFAGTGAQYNPKFAKNQSRLLGISLQLVENPQQVKDKVQELLSNPDLWQSISVNGKKRLGSAGGAKKIARELLSKLTKRSEV